MVAVPTPSAVQVEQLTGWLYCLGTPVVQVCAIQQSTGFVLVDAGVVGHEHAYLEALAGLAGTGPQDVRITEIFLTHGHEDHTGSAAELARITGATVRGPTLTRTSSRSEPFGRIRSSSRGRSRCLRSLGGWLPRHR